MDFKDQVIVITGAGAGLGKDYALFFSSKGAKVVVNDLGMTSGKKSADVVVDEITKNGGTAVANYESVENGESLIKTAIDAFGRVDCLINNAGILRDKAFKNMETKDWDLIVKVHLNGMYACTKAVWPHFIKQKYGRIINVTSPSGLYGSFGQANYSMAKAGIIGFTLTLAKEGAKYGIMTNAIAPVAATAMTQNLMSQELLDLLKVQYITPLVAYLSGKDVVENGAIYEIAGSYVSRVRWQRSEGVFFGAGMSMENVKKRMEDINDFSRENTYNDEDQTCMQIVLDNIEKLQSNKTSNTAKSDEIFDLITKYLAMGEGAENTKKVQAIYQFDIVQKRGGPVLKSWTIDMKNGNGKCQSGKSEKYDSLFTMTDGDFVAVCTGKLNPQMAFIQGKMKIKGNMKKATSFTPDLFPKPSSENIEKYGKLYKAKF